MNDEWREQWRWLNALRYARTKSQMSLDKIIERAFFCCCRCFVSDCKCNNDKLLFIHSCVHYTMLSSGARGIKNWFVINYSSPLRCVRARVRCWRRVLLFLFSVVVLSVYFSAFFFWSIKLSNFGDIFTRIRDNCTSDGIAVAGDRFAATTHEPSTTRQFQVNGILSFGRKSSSALERVAIVSVRFVVQQFQ